MKHILLPALFAVLPIAGFAQEQAAPQMPQQAPMQIQQVPMPEQQQMQQPMPMQQQVQMPAAPQAPVGDPSYYGQVDLVNNTAPALVYSTPAVVQAPPPGVYYPPVYLRVPPVYYQNWPQYCGYYNACFYPVFFVQEGWYLNVYSPWYRRYYPYGRAGFRAHVYYNGHGGYGHGEGHNERGQFHDERR